MLKHETPLYRCLSHGTAALTDSEVLALVTGVSRDAAMEALADAGSLRNLLMMPLAEIRKYPAFGQARWAMIQAAMELTRRHYAETLDRTDPLTSPDATRRFLQSKLRDVPHEIFVCLFLDNRHRVIRYVELFRGTIDGSSVHPREVVKAALGFNAAAVIFAHNHPSGVAEPSHADERLTRRLRDALGLVDIRVLDHVVVGDGDMVSFAERGLL